MSVTYSLETHSSVRVDGTSVFTLSEVVEYLHLSGLRCHYYYGLGISGILARLANLKAEGKASVEYLP